MKKQIEQNNKVDTRLDIIDFIISVAAFTLFTFFFVYSLAVEKQYADWKVYVSYFLNILGILNFLTTIKKQIANVYFGFAWSILSGLINWFDGNIANAIRFFTISASMQIVVLVVWMRKSKDKKTVQTRNSSKTFFWVAVTITSAATALLTFFETQPWFMEPIGMEPSEWFIALPDALTFVVSITSAIFFIKRYNEYWNFVCITSIAGFALWLGRLITTPTDTHIIIMFLGSIIDLLLCAKGLLEWNKLLPKVKKLF